MKKVFTLAILMLVIAPMAQARVYRMRSVGGGGGGGSYTPPPTPVVTQTQESIGGGGGVPRNFMKPRLTSPIVVDGFTVSFLGSLNGYAYLEYEDGTVIKGEQAVYHTLEGKAGTAKIYLVATHLYRTYDPVLLGEVEL